MISKKEVQHIAKLARLSLSKQEIEKFQKELSSIIEELNEADLSGSGQKESFIIDENIWREDEPTKSKKEKLLEMMPETKDGYLKVKKIL